MEHPFFSALHRGAENTLHRLFGFEPDGSSRRIQANVVACASVSVQRNRRRGLLVYVRLSVSDHFRTYKFT